MARINPFADAETLETDPPPDPDRAARPGRHRGGDPAHLRDALRGPAARSAAAGARSFLPLFLLYARPSISSSACTATSGASPRFPTSTNIFRAATVLAVSLLVLDYVLLAPNVYGQLLLRQDHHPAVLVPADVLPGRLAHRLPLFPLRAHAPARQGRRRDADAGARQRRRRRSAAARDRERRGQEDLAGRHPLAVAARPRPVDPRHPGARRHRRSRARGRRSGRPRHPRDAR